MFRALIQIFPFSQTTLAGYRFTGELPDDMCSPEINNDFFQSSSQSEGMIGTHTHCDSIACPPGTISVEGMYPCTQCEMRKHPYLGQRGESCMSSSQSDILKMFYRSTTKYGRWKSGNDWVDDSVDVCDFTGVTCDKTGNIVKIQLSNMGLTGTISESIGFLQFLEGEFLYL